MPDDRIVTAQEVWNEYQTRSATAGPAKMPERHFVEKYRAKLPEFSDVSGSEKTLADIANGILSADPTTLTDFPRWARHVRGLELARIDELRKNFNPPLKDYPREEHKFTARRIIDVASRFGVVDSQIVSPTEAMSHAELCKIANALAARAENLPQQPAESSDNPDDESFLPPSKLADFFGVKPEPLRARLKRWRASNLDGWIENQERSSREPQFLYRVGAVRRIANGLKASSERTPK